MPLAIYDLDDTLINEDCSRLWIRFLADKGLAPAEEILAEEARLDADYHAGKLCMKAYLQMQLGPHIGQPLSVVAEQVETFIDEYVTPHIRPAAVENIRQHQARGDRCLVISASTTFLVKPIAKRLGIDDAIGVEIELEDGRITGCPEGVICYQEGKVTRLKEWLENENESTEGCWFYSDSRNDLPLLNLAENPVAVSADSTLQKVADEKGWLSLDWRL